MCNLGSWFLVPGSYVRIYAHKPLLRYWIIVFNIPGCFLRTICVSDLARCSFSCRLPTPLRTLFRWDCPSPGAVLILILCL
jgi:hypothetical protein